MPKHDGKSYLDNARSYEPGHMPISVAASTSAVYTNSPRRASMPITDEENAIRPAIQSTLPTSYVPNMQEDQTHMPVSWMQHIIPQLCASTPRRASMPMLDAAGATAPLLQSMLPGNCPVSTPNTNAPSFSLVNWQTPLLDYNTDMGTILTSVSENERKLGNSLLPTRNNTATSHVKCIKVAKENGTEQGAGKNEKRIRYQCEHCKKYFTRPSSLSTHMYTHTGEKPHQCIFPGCHKRFSVLSNLRRHSKLHQESPSRNHRKTQYRHYYLGHPYHLFPATPLELPPHQMLDTHSHAVPMPLPYMQPQFLVQGPPGHLLANQDVLGMPPPPPPPPGLPHLPASSPEGIAYPGAPTMPW
ncbi:hypothetical protein H4R24_000732 [Coemansia sp. RSA 988]|nr:hypothetical protein H4R24_000732 [Coemansia sp. RSA 988]